jgi:hypothetical protein
VKIGIFTRTGFHHTSFINRLQGEFETLFVLREAYPQQHQSDKISDSSPETNNPDRLFLEQFTSRYSAGFLQHPILGTYLKSRFDLVSEKTGTKYLNIACGEINSPVLREYLQTFNPDIIAVLGSSIIKQEMISLPSAGMLNIHSGLSPYYRGTWSYGWPIVNGEPEYIGVTVHYVNAGIDTGDIIYQTKPLLEKTDDLNSIFLKVVAEGIELTVKAVGEISSTGTIRSEKQPHNAGRLYQTKDFNAETARTCLKQLEKGIIRDYLSSREERDPAVKLFGYIPPRISR